MTESEAIRLAGMLAAIGHGWTDLHIDMYAGEFQSWDDADAAEVVIRRAIRTWNRAVRIPFGELHQDYLREVDRRAALRPGIPSGRVVPFERGVQIAWEAYEREARRTGREPNRALFGKYLGNIGPST